MPSVDLVFEGGGVKAIALVGALAVLREAGYQAVRVAGTSAGAIAAAFFVAGEEPQALRDALLDFSFASLRDVGWEDRLPAVGPLFSLALDFGLYEGNALEAWVRGRLEARGVRTFGDLPWFEGDCRLQVVVSDVTQRRLLLLPRDAAWLGVSPRELDVARMVRASASLPLYFEPLRWHNPQTGREHLLVDGGLLSNFPVWAFDAPGLPRWPTFGLLLVEDSPRDPLGAELGPPPASPNVLAYLRDLVQTALEARDRRYLESADFVRTIAIPTLGVGTTQFDLPRGEALALYEAGRLAAQKFLAGWDFAGYARAFRRDVPPTRRELLRRHIAQVQDGNV